MSNSRPVRIFRMRGQPYIMLGKKKILLKDINQKQLNQIIKKVRFPKKDKPKIKDSVNLEKNILNALKQFASKKLKFPRARVRSSDKDRIKEDKFALEKQERLFELNQLREQKEKLREKEKQLDEKQRELNRKDIENIKERQNFLALPSNEKEEIIQDIKEDNDKEIEKLRSVIKEGIKQLNDEINERLKAEKFAKEKMDEAKISESDKLKIEKEKAIDKLKNDFEKIEKAESELNQRLAEFRELTKEKDREFITKKINELANVGTFKKDRGEIIVSNKL